MAIASGTLLPCSLCKLPVAYHQRCVRYHMYSYHCQAISLMVSESSFRALINRSIDV